MEINAGEPVGAVESVKSASDVISPVSGTVIEGNFILENKPKTINESAEHEGWIARIKVADSTELGSLMEPEKYLETVGEK
jgi:glycine cleavage system H protein